MKNQFAASTHDYTGTEARARAFDLQLFTDGGDGNGGGNNNASNGTDDGGNNAGANSQQQHSSGGQQQQGQQGNGEGQTGAPKTYADFKVPEGLAFDRESAGDFFTVAKELNLTQDQAQKLVDVYAGRMAAMQEAHQKQSEAWHAESVKLYKPEEINLANKTMVRFADQEFVEFLAATGLSNHPKMIAVFKSIGSQIAEGKFVDSPGRGAVSDGELFYPSMKKK